MESETEMLRDIYWRFIRGNVSVDEAALQVTEYTRQHKCIPGNLDLEPMSDEERLKAGELLQFLLQPIIEEYLLDRISLNDAARQMALVLSPHSIWSSPFTTYDSPITERRKLEALWIRIGTALEEIELEAESISAKKK
jgi:hypothetical protein